MIATTTTTAAASLTVSDTDLTPLEQAVETALSSDPTISTALRTEAREYCNLFQQRPDAWRICCQQFLLRSRYPETLHSAGTSQTNGWMLASRFWYLRVVTEQLSRLSSAERQALHELFTVYLQEILPWRAAATTEGPADNPAVTSKLALLFVRCVAEDYPIRWPDAFSSLLAYWAKRRCSRQQARQEYVAVTQLLLAICEVFHEEIVTDDLHRPFQDKSRNAEVKNSLRNGDIITLTEAWCSILQDFRNPTLTRIQSAPLATAASPVSTITSSTTALGEINNAEMTDIPLVTRCLLVMARYITWIDIQILANECLMPLFFELLCRRSECGPAVMEVLAAMVHKGMDPGQRIVMVHQLQLVDQLTSRTSLAELQDEKPGAPDASTSYMVNCSCHDPDTYVCGLADFVNLMGTDLTESLRELRAGYENAVAQVADEQNYYLGNMSGVSAVGINPFFTPITSPKMWLQMQTEAWRMILQLLPKAILVFSHPHPSVAERVIPFLSALVKLWKSMITRRSKGAETGQSLLESVITTSPESPIMIPLVALRSTLQELFEATLVHLQYPYWFNFDDPEGNFQQEQFLSFRDEVTNLFRRLCSVDDTTSMLFLREILRQLRHALGTSPTLMHANQIEAALYVVYVAGEQYKDLVSVLWDYDSPLAECLRLLFSSQELLGYPHPQIQVRMLNIVGRYMPFLLNPSFHAPGSNYTIDTLELLVRSMTMRNVNTEVQHRATVTLLKFVRSGSTALAKLASHILERLNQSGFLHVKYIPSSEWGTTSVVSDTLQGPSRCPEFTFEDQNRCFEIAGLLLSQCEDERAGSLLQHILNHIETPFEDAGEIGMAEKSSLGIHKLSQINLVAGVDWTTRLLEAMTNLHKGCCPKLANQPVWRRCFRCAILAVENLGLHSRVRSSVISLARRLLSLSDLTSYMTQLILQLFDQTVIAFAEMFDFTASHNTAPARENDAQLCSALARIAQCRDGRRHRQPQQPSTVPTYSGHGELSQLASLVHLTVLTLKEQAADNFLLVSMPLESTTSQQFLLGNSDDPWPQRGPMFLRIFGQLVDCWRVLPDDASDSELIREKNDVRRDIFQVLQTIASACPKALLSLFEMQFVEVSPPSTVSVLEWMATGVKPISVAGTLSVSFIPGTVLCLRAWVAFLTYVLTSNVMELSSNVNLQNLLFERLRLSTLLHEATQLAFFLNLEDPQHNRVLQEVCTICRLFSGSLPNTNDAKDPKLHALSIQHPELLEELHHIFLTAMPSQVCSPQDATLVLQAVAQAPTSREAKDILKKWIMTQQLSAQPPE